MRFDEVIAARTVSAADGRARLELDVTEGVQNMNAVLHGGVIATLVDIAGTVAIKSADRQGRSGVLTDLNVSFFAPAPVGSTVVADAQVLKIGKTLAFVTVDIRRVADGALVAQGRMTKFQGLTMEVTSERELVAVALALGAEEVGGLTPAEQSLARDVAQVRPALVRHALARIGQGEDPLGAAFCSLRTPAERRARGATYTPAPIVSAMLAWAAQEGRPDRIVDPGAGSGRFIVSAGRRFPRARLLAVEIDPLAALLVRAHLKASGLASRAEVTVADYRALEPCPIEGRTLFIGNPPYVRHHLLGQRWKEWLTRTAGARGLPASQLAGLHVHFFLATAALARPGDFGAFVTAAEWLDVNYGVLVRRLFLGDLGGSALHVVEPKAAPFPDAATTAAIACFHIGARPPAVRLRRVAALAELGALGGGRSVRREALDAARRWTPLLHRARKRREGYVELGELCRVRRGQVTGANDFWIAGDRARDLPPSVLFAAVTRARELYGTGRVLADASRLRRVIDLPQDLDCFHGEEKRQVEAWLRRARAAGVHEGYIARHRKRWWSVGLYEPAPILATYMARRPPGFVRNTSAARHINIAHGIYPREPMSEGALTALADHLATHTSTADGRTYAGGLTKFEPREMERLLVPYTAISGRDATPISAYTAK